MESRRRRVCAGKTTSDPEIGQSVPDAFRNGAIFVIAAACGFVRKTVVMWFQSSVFFSVAD